MRLSDDDARRVDEYVGQYFGGEIPSCRSAGETARPCGEQDELRVADAYVELYFPRAPSKS